MGIRNRAMVLLIQNFRVFKNPNFIVAKIETYIQLDKNVNKNACS
jgi:hypothetical protein